MDNKNKSKNKEMSKGEAYRLITFFSFLIFGVLKGNGIKFIYALLAGACFFILSKLLFDKFGNKKITKLSGTQIFIILVGIPFLAAFIYVLVFVTKILIVIF